MGVGAVKEYLGPAILGGSQEERTQQTQSHLHSPPLALSVFHGLGLRCVGCVLSTTHPGHKSGLIGHYVPPWPAQSSGPIC